MIPSVSSRSTVTAIPSDERTSLTGTSNAISRVVTRWVSATFGRTRWMPGSSASDTRPALTTRPTEPGGTRRNRREMIPTMRNDDRADDDHRPQGGDQRQEQARCGEPDGDQDQLEADRRLALDPDDERHPPVRVRPLERLGRVQRRGVDLDDLDVRAGEDLAVDLDRLRDGRRHGLRGRRRGLLFGHWAVLQELSVTDDARADGRTTVDAERVGSGAGAVPPAGTGRSCRHARGRPRASGWRAPRRRRRPGRPARRPRASAGRTAGRRRSARGRG